LTDGTLLAGALSWWRIQSLGQRSGLFSTQIHVTTTLFPHNKHDWMFGHVEWIQSEQYPWYRRKWWALSSFGISTSKLSWHVGMLVVSVTNFVICFQDHVESTMFHLQW